MGSGKHLRRAIDKHGVNNFTKEVLHVFDNEDEMNLKEKELVTEEFCLRKDTYNLCNGGQGGFGYINRVGANRKHVFDVKKMTILAHQKLRVLRCDEKWFEEWRQNLSKAQRKRTPVFGRKHTAESKKKMSIAKKGVLIGERNSQFGTIWITNGIENKKIRGEIPEGWRRGRFPS